MVAWYSRRMDDKHVAPIVRTMCWRPGRIARLCWGEEVLDVGVGTGRFHAAGACRQACNGCRQLTGDAGRDSSSSRRWHVRRCRATCWICRWLMAHLTRSVPWNVMIAFPHWREVLAHWAKGVRAGAAGIRCVFAGSLFCALQPVCPDRGRHATGAGDEGAVSRFNLRICVDDFVQVANQLSLYRLWPSCLIVAFWCFDCQSAAGPVAGRRAALGALVVVAVHRRIPCLIWRIISNSNSFAPLTSRVSASGCWCWISIADPPANQRWQARQCRDQCCTGGRPV